MNPKIYYGNRQPYSQHPQHSQQQPYYSKPYQPERRDTILLSKRMLTERKTFTLEIRENHRGRFMSIIEEGRSRSMVIVPISGWAEFKTLFNDVMTAAEQLPPPAPPAPRNDEFMDNPPDPMAR